MEEAIDKIARVLSRTARMAVLTGAGVSAESGIPTFRGKDGFWKDEDVTRLATLEGFLADPVKVWQWYDWRRGQVAAAEPNPGHYAIAGLEKMVAARGGSCTLYQIAPLRQG